MGTFLDHLLCRYWIPWSDWLFPSCAGLDGSFAWVRPGRWRQSSEPATGRHPRHRRRHPCRLLPPGPAWTAGWSRRCLHRKETIKSEMLTKLVLLALHDQNIVRACLNICSVSCGYQQTSLIIRISTKYIKEIIEFWRHFENKIEELLWLSG